MFHVERPNYAFQRGRFNGTPTRRGHCSDTGSVRASPQLSSPPLDRIGGSQPEAGKAFHRAIGSVGHRHPARAEWGLGDHEAAADGQESHGTLGRRGWWPERPSHDEVERSSTGRLARQLLGSSRAPPSTGGRAGGHRPPPPGTRSADAASRGARRMPAGTSSPTQDPAAPHRIPNRGAVHRKVPAWRPARPRAPRAGPRALARQSLGVALPRSASRGSARSRRTQHHPAARIFALGLGRDAVDLRGGVVDDLAV